MMYQSFDDAVDAGITQIRIAKSHAERDLTGEVLWTLEAFLQKRAGELGLPLDSRDIQIQIFAERLVVKAAWMVPVTLLNRTLPLNFSLKQSRKLPQ